LFYGSSFANDLPVFDFGGSFLVTDTWSTSPAFSAALPSKWMARLIRSVIARSMTFAEVAC